MHLFIAFVVIVVLLGLGFGRAMLYVGLATVGGIGLLIALMLYCLSVPGPTQVSQAAPTTQSAECDVNDLFPDPGTPGAACWVAYHAAHRVAQAERTDIYQQSLQILSGEKLTPLN